jgi:hypothetical protein
MNITHLRASILLHMLLTVSLNDTPKGPPPCDASNGSANEISEYRRRT